MPDITWERSDLRFFIKVNKADKTSLLTLKDVGIVLSAEKFVDHVFSPIEPWALVLAVLVKNPGYIRGTKHSNRAKEGCDQGWKDAKNDDNFVIELQYIGSIAFTAGIVGQLSDLNDIVDRPDTVT